MNLIDILRTSQYHCCNFQTDFGCDVAYTLECCVPDAQEAQLSGSFQEQYLDYRFFTMITELIHIVDVFVTAFDFLPL